MTAYYTLKYTNYPVVLFEAGKVAHAATGHNAGQLVTYFERPFSGLVKDFGAEAAVAGEQGIQSAWHLIEEIISSAKLQTPLARFTGYAGLKNQRQVLGFLADNYLRSQHGAQRIERILVAEEMGEARKLIEQGKTFEGALKVSNTITGIVVDEGLQVSGSSDVITLGAAGATAYLYGFLAGY